MSGSLAVVTGTSSGIGAAIANALIAANWRVVGISRRQTLIESELYTHITLDLNESKRIPSAIEEIIASHGPIAALINNAGIGYFAPHEELSPTEIQEMVSVNLLAPLLITRSALRSLKETSGHIVSISSFSALESSSFGAAYAATKAGIKHFSDSLFDEVRKSGVKVTTITPDITRTPFYDHLNFYPQEDPAAAISPEYIASAVLNALSNSNFCVTTHITLRPQRLLLAKRVAIKGKIKGQESR